MRTSELTLHEKICLVTGATSGIGEATALALAQRGATTLLVGRNPANGADAVARIKSQTSNPHVIFLQADLSSQAEVYELVRCYKQQYSQLHILVNNAGTLLAKRQESCDGIEMTLALNHLSPFLLTNLLLDMLRASAPARVINISSALHSQARLDLDDLQSHKHYSGMMAYNRSKLANLLFTYEMARRLDGAGVTVNAVGLSLTRTNLYRRQNIGVLMGLLCAVLTRAAPTAEKAAEAIVYLATSSDVAHITGKYFVGQQAVPSSEQSYDQNLAKRLWQMSAMQTGLTATT